MREIKFRVWCKNKNEWEKDNIALYQDGSRYHTDIKGRHMYVSPDSHIIQMFTGLKDKNNVEIYEEHKCRYKDDSGMERIGIVKYRLCEFYLEAIDGDDEGNQNIQLHPDYDIEIIGENPELLDGDE